MDHVRTLTVKPSRYHASLNGMASSYASLCQYYGFVIRGGYEKDELFSIDIGRSLADWTTLFGLLNPLKNHDILLEVNGQRTSGMLSAYLGSIRFSKPSFEYDTQRAIRHHVYKTFKPATTTMPRELTQSEKVKCFYVDDTMGMDGKGYIEKGQYKGHMYFTIAAHEAHVNIFNERTLEQYDISAIPQRSASFKKAVGILPKNYSGDVSDWDLHSY